MNFVCNLQHCHLKFCSSRQLISHLKQHIKDGLKVKCPYIGCNSFYKVISSFSAHLSRKHRSQPLQDNEVSVANTSTNCDSLVLVQNENLPESSNSASIQDESNDLLFTQSMLKKYALHFMKMQYQFLIPESTVSKIIIEMKSLVKESVQHFNVNRLKNIMLACNVDSSKVDDVLKKYCDLPYPETFSVLQTTYMRKQFFDKTFPCVLPVSMNLSTLHTDQPVHTFDYVPILKTLQFLFKDPTIRKDYFNQPKTSLTLMKDFCDGELFKSNRLYCMHKYSLQIILFQDAFEVANPLGSAKKKHKLLAVYLTLGNILPHHRSKVSLIQLVLLCKEKYLTSESAYRSLFTPLKNDLLKLESQGIDLGFDKVVYGTIAFIAGDNLGSHWLGGFVTNFSTAKHFCRYCLKSKESFKNSPSTLGEPRTVANYNAAVRVIRTLPNENNDGIKFSSIFNELKFFHVAYPGLPPCLGHDLFEGVVQYDFPLFVKYFVENKWFDIKLINHRLTHFSFLFLDAYSSPPPLPLRCEKLPGNACQNWCLLRFFSLFVFDKVLDYENDVWRLYITLKKIVEMVCAPTISRVDLPYLKTLIVCYIDKRAESFSSSPLRPKHHYLLHYPGLILKFGPLMRTWTMHFESKHSYFKNVVRSCGNFVNLTKTLSHHHQRLQSCLLSEGLIASDITYGQSSSLTFSTEVLSAMREMSIDIINSRFFVKVEFKGIAYCIGQCVVLQKTESGDLLVGVIKCIVMKSSQICLVIKRCLGLYFPALELYKLEPCLSRSFACISLFQLRNYYPLSVYTKNGTDIIVLKYYIPSDLN